MKKLIAYDDINGEFEDFESIEDARKELEEIFYQNDEGYHPDGVRSCKIYEQIEELEFKITEERANYKYDYDDEAPEGEEHLVWPYDSAFEQVGKHNFALVPTEREKKICQLIEKLQKSYMSDAECAKDCGTGEVHVKEFENKAIGLGLAANIVKKHCGIK